MRAALGEVRGVLVRGCYASQRHGNSASVSLVILIGWSSERGKHGLSLSTGRSDKTKRSQCFSPDSCRLNGNLIQGIDDFFSLILLVKCREVGHDQCKQQTVLYLCLHVSMTNVNLASVVCYHPCPVKLGRFGSRSCQHNPSCPLWLSTESLPLSRGREQA